MGHFENGTNFCTRFLIQEKCFSLPVSILLKCTEYSPIVPQNELVQGSCVWNCVSVGTWKDCGWDSGFVPWRLSSTMTSGWLFGYGFQVTPFRKDLTTTTDTYLSEETNLSWPVISFWFLQIKHFQAVEALFLSCQSWKRAEIAINVMNTLADLKISVPFQIFLQFCIEELAYTLIFLL